MNRTVLEVIKQPAFIIGVIILLIPLIPGAQEYVNENFDSLNTLLSFVLTSFGISSGVQLKKAKESYPVTDTKRL